MAKTPRPHITAIIADRSIERPEVLRWEDKRITAAARKLSLPVLPGGDVSARREALLRAKLELGPAEITARLHRDIKIADFVAYRQARVSRRRRLCTIDLHVAGTSATTFIDWFTRATAESDQAAMLKACPDHFSIETRADGRQAVLETTGGSPFASLFFIDYGDLSSLVTAADPDYPEQIAGVAFSDSGQPIGGVRHQFRSTSQGFDARLTVEFPLTTLPSMIKAHRWHLACEFSNWITNAHDDAKPSG